MYVLYALRHSQTHVEFEDSPDLLFGNESLSVIEG